MKQIEVFGVHLSFVQIVQEVLAPYFIHLVQLVIIQPLLLLFQLLFQQCYFIHYLVLVQVLAKLAVGGEGCFVVAIDSVEMFFIISVLS